MVDQYTQEKLTKNSDLIIFYWLSCWFRNHRKMAIPKQKTKIIHIDIDPKVIGANYKTLISLVADAKLTLIEL